MRSLTEGRSACGAEYYDTYVRSASTQFLIPAVLRVRMYVSAKEARSGRLTLSRRNIMLRDKCTCQCAPTLLQSRPAPGEQNQSIALL